MSESEVTSGSDRAGRAVQVAFMAIAATAVWWVAASFLFVFLDVPEPYELVFDRLRFLEVLAQLSLVGAAVTGIAFASEGEGDLHPIIYLICAAILVVPLAGPFGTGVSLGLFVLAAALSGVIVAFSQPRSAKPLMDGVLTSAAATVVLLGSAAVGIHAAVDTANDTPAEFGLVPEYCAYGSRSLDQWYGCALNVSAKRVERLDTNAARFAKGDLDECLKDAGPFCRAR